MKPLFLFLIFICCNLSVNSQIYNKKIIYNYEVKNTSVNGEQKRQNMYLVCHGKSWKLDPKKQFSIDWVDEGRDILSLNNCTGVIDNRDTIWLHPPRHNIYFVHEFTPFPEVRLPLKVGKKWITDFGYVWSSKELNIPAGVKVRPQYCIKAKFEEYSDILRRNISCYKIVGVINHLLIKSKWVGVFNDELGFIRMEFQNINQSTTKMQLTDCFDWEQCKNRFGLFSL